MPQDATLKRQNSQTYLISLIIVVTLPIKVPLILAADLFCSLSLGVKNNFDG